jgi:hypothetical protein
LEIIVTTRTARTLACAVALLGTLGVTPSLQAQLGIGTWVRQDTGSGPHITMDVAACCHGGYRLTYHLDIQGNTTLMTVESPFDGTEVPVLIAGKPSGETMAITRVDTYHTSTVVKMNGRPFGTSRSTLSADGKTLTVVNEFAMEAGDQTAGKHTEVWVRK